MSYWVNESLTAIVQNYGAKRDLTIGNVPIGRLIMKEEADSKAQQQEQQDDPSKERPKDGSIIIVLATDVSPPVVLDLEAALIIFFQRLRYTQLNLRG
jgi:hypothetical protein